MSKTIVMIGNTSWGMLRFRGDLMQYFIKQDHRVIVIAPYDEWSCKIEAIGAKFIIADVDRKGTNPITDFLYTLRLARILIDSKPDIVLTYTIKPVLYGTFASWIAQVPKRISVITGLGNTFSKENLINKITKVLYKLLLKFSSEVWFLNSDDVSTFIKNNLVHENKTFLLPGEGVDIDHYYPISAPKRNHTFTLISRMLWDKGVGIFAECAKELKPHYPHLNFLLVGPTDDGNPEAIPLSQLQEWDRQGILKYVGPKDDVREILKDTSCLVHPTYYKEGLPRVLMEANAMGIPCITTNIPGCRDVILNNINGFLVESENKEELKQAILIFMELEIATLNELAQEGRSRIINTFSSKKIFKIYKERIFSA